MAKRVDITDKLSFDENPCLVIKGKELEVNADAPTMLKVMGLMNGDPGAREIMDAYKTIFPEKSRKELESSLKLNFNDLVIVIQEAVQLIAGGEDNTPGEQ